MRVHAWVIWRSLVLQTTDTVRSPMVFVVSVLQPATFLSLVLLARAMPDPAFTTRTVVGATAVGLWSTTLWSTGSILRREITYGTMAAILARPVSLFAVLVGKSLGVALFGLGAITATTTVVLVALNPSLVLPGPATMLVITVLAIASGCALGTLLSSLLVLTRGASRMIEALVYPVFVLGGLLVPVELLPEFLRWPATFVSLHVIVDMADDPSPQWTEAAWVLALCGGYLAVSRVAMESLLRRGRRRGTLEFT